MVLRTCGSEHAYAIKTVGKRETNTAAIRDILGRSIQGSDVFDVRLDMVRISWSNNTCEDVLTDGVPAHVV